TAVKVRCLCAGVNDPPVGRGGRPRSYGVKRPLHWQAAEQLSGCQAESRLTPDCAPKGCPTVRTLIKDATCVLPSGTQRVNVLLEDATILGIAPPVGAAVDEVIDASG